jgi:enoyl-CoA hydratase
VEFFTLRREGHVLEVILDHPRSPVNAVDEQLHDEFNELFNLLRREDEARAILLTANGRAFSAGGDYEWFEKLREPAVLDRLRRDAKQIIWNLLDIEVPIVCAMNGSAAGLGATVALLCDVIVMADNASIIDPHVKVGLVAGDGGTAIWPLLLGPLAAKRHLLLGEPLTASEALRLGVAAEVCAQDNVLAVGRQWAQRIAALPPLAVRGTKYGVNVSLKRALLDSFEVAVALEIPCFDSADHKEAVAATRERRPGVYQGR